MKILTSKPDRTEIICLAIMGYGGIGTNGPMAVLVYEV